MCTVLIVVFPYGFPGSSEWFRPDFSTCWFHLWLIQERSLYFKQTGSFVL